MDKIKEKFSSIIDGSIKEVKDFVSQYGDEVIGEIKINQLYAGMRGMPALICET